MRESGWEISPPPKAARAWTGVHCNLWKAVRMQLSDLRVPVPELWMSGSFANSSFESCAAWNPKVSGTLGRGHQYVQKNLGPWDQTKGLTLSRMRTIPSSLLTQIPRATKPSTPLGRGSLHYCKNEIQKELVIHQALLSPPRSTLSHQLPCLRHLLLVSSAVPLPCFSMTILSFIPNLHSGMPLR